MPWPSGISMNTALYADEGRRVVKRTCEQTLSRVCISACRKTSSRRKQSLRERRAASSVTRYIGLPAVTRPTSRMMKRLDWTRIRQRASSSQSNCAFSTPLNTYTRRPAVTCYFQFHFSTVTPDYAEELPGEFPEQHS